MACEKPIRAWRPASNSGPIHFNRPNSSHAYIEFDLPCGYCILCQEEKARQWAVRIHHEAQLRPNNSFITLTYEDSKLPPYNSLRFQDLYDFWKRLKIHLWRKERQRIKYYAAGEYGDLTLRPHYHACIFGHDFTSDGRIIRQGQHPLWTSPTLERLWGHGMVSVGTLNFQTARYTASYVTKKLRSKQQYVRVDKETGELIALEQPAASMSRNLAREWWNKYRHHVSANDVVVIEGTPQKPPKAYDRWLGEENEIPLQMLKEQRIKLAPKLDSNQRRARAENARARRKKSKTV